MRFFFIDTLVRSDPKVYYSSRMARGIGPKNVRMAKGKVVAPDWPAEPPTIMPSESTPATKLTSVIPNAASYLIVATELRDVIQAHCEGAAIEYLPVALLSHKDKVQSRDYFFVNPIGTVDCLNHGKSEIVYSQSTPGAVVGVDKYVIDPAKARDAPNVFRIKETPGEYVVKEPLARAFAQHPFTNLYLREIEVDPPAPAS
jgi:hypothetical protein